VVPVVLSSPPQAANAQSRLTGKMTYQDRMANLIARSAVESVARRRKLSLSGSLCQADLGLQARAHDSAAPADVLSEPGETARHDNLTANFAQGRNA
jgi:hypothetical protein